MKRAPTKKQPKHLTGTRLHELSIILFVAAIILFLMVKIVFF